MVRLSEQTLNRSEVIITCIELGNRFIEHFDKIYKNCNSTTIPHWCKEMQAWYNECRRLKFKHSKKTISKQQLSDYFLLCGSGIELLFEDEDEQILYDEFIGQLLKRDQIYDCIIDVLS